MENRFGIKDFFLFALLGGLVVIVVAAMIQYDRQFDVLRLIRDGQQQQTAELSRLGRAIANASFGAGAQNFPTTATAFPGGAGLDPFAAVKEAQAKSDYATGDWVVDNFGVTVGKLTPLVSQDVYGSYVQARVQETLAYRNPDTLEYVPLLARSWKISPDGMTITFQLRQGVTFSDGTPFTADDVVFTFDWAMNPAVDAPRDRAYLAKIAKVTRGGDHEVTFQYKEPYFEAFALAAGLNIFPKHFYSKYTPEQFNQAPGLLLGTGPYRLADPADWKPGGDRIELLRNDRYWGEPPPFNKLVWYQIVEDAPELTMFRNGELDIVGPPAPEYRKMLDDKKLVDRTAHYEYESPLSGYSYVAWNQQRGGKPTRWADKRVRQAMTLLCDRERVAREVFLGYASAASGPFAKVSRQSAPDVRPWPFDVTRAIALLKDAGYEDRDRDGVIESPAGEPFKFALTYGGGNATYERVVLLLKDTFARAGITLVPGPEDWPVLQKKMNQRDYDAITLGWSGGVETDIYQMFHSSQIADGGDNIMSYANPALDKLIDEARATVDEEKRMPLWQQCHRILNDDQPYTFLLNRKSTFFMDARFKNVRTSKLGLNYVQRETGPNPWFVPKAMQKYK